MFHNLKSHGTLDNSTLDLRILNQNILYITRQVDTLLKLLTSLKSDINIQKQADDYYDEIPKHPDEDKELD